MTSSNQCGFVSKLFFRLVGTAIVVLMVGGPLYASSASAASGNTYTGNYVIENSLGKTVIPIPDGVWHKVHEEVQHQDSGSGDFVSTNQFQTIYLVQLDDIRVSGVVRISTNKEFHSAGWWKPSNFCYRKKWKYLKQESVFKKSAFCWGVRYVRIRTKPRQDTSWERAVKKIEKAGWFAPLGIRGTRAKYTRSDSDKMLNVSYFFFLIPRMSWLAARNWLYDLKPRIQAGFQGKFLTPPKGPAAVKGLMLNEGAQIKTSLGEEQRRLSRSKVRSRISGNTEVGVLRRPTGMQFDGEWRAFIEFVGPRCYDTSETMVTIAKGKVSGAVETPLGNLRISGGVLANGDIKDMTASKGSYNMYFSGKFTGDTAEGTFELQTCDGTFKFTRKK